jgi:ADP-ribose pyrophosphatase YjhB (NUDIX family)
MSRAQVIVIRSHRLLKVKHRQAGEEWSCLPGDGIEPNESPEAEAFRELREECRVRGTLIKATSVVEYGPDDRHHTLHVEIGDQTPQLGHDPEDNNLPASQKQLAGIGWLSLDDLAERDRAYLWTVDLLTVAPFAADLETWTKKPAPPRRETQPTDAQP